MRDEPIGSGAIGFFVGHGQENHIAIEFNFFALQHDHHDQLRQAFVFHVLSAAAPQPAVFNLAAEGRNLPVRGIAGNHIHVVQQNDRPLRLSVVCGNLRPQIAASRRILEDAILNPFLIKNILVERNRAHFVAGRIGGVDAQIFLHPG